MAAAVGAAAAWPLLAAADDDTRRGKPTLALLAAGPLVAAVGLFAAAPLARFGVLVGGWAGEDGEGASFADGAAVVALAALPVAAALWRLGGAPERRLAQVVAHAWLVPFAFIGATAPG